MSKRAGKITLDPSHPAHSLFVTATVWSTLQSSEHQNDQTQEQFLPSSNLSHKHLTLNMEHTTLLFFFLLSTFFLFFSHITQHSIQNITKQNNRHILNISKSSQKGGREGRTKTQKSLLHTITYIKQKTLPSINGRRPGPTDSRRCTFTSHSLLH